MSKPPLPKYESFGKKMRAHMEHIAKKRFPVDPIMEDEILPNIEALEALLTAAKCPDQNCANGLIIQEVTTTGIGWEDDGNGNPVAIAIPVQDFEQQQCQWCYERDRVLNKFQGFDEEVPQRDHEWDIEMNKRDAK